MNEAAGIVERQVDDMLKLLRRYESAEIEKLLDRAYDTARARVRAARRDARLRVRAAVRELRADADERLKRLRAGNEARERELGLRRAGEVLAEGRTLLGQRLAALWENGEARRRWTTGVVKGAAAALPGRRWIVEHASDWPEDEREAFSREVAEQSGEAPELRALESIGAGLRIIRDGAIVDATLDVLLRRRSELDARLLAAYYAELREAGEEGP